MHVHVHSAQEAQEELQEFQQMSRDYEVELEAELKHCEVRNRELGSANDRLKMELENYKVPGLYPPRRGMREALGGGGGRRHALVRIS